MGSLSGCLKKLGISGPMESRIRRMVNDYRTDGVLAEDAGKKAVSDLIRETRDHHTSVLQQIHDALPEDVRYSVFPDLKPPETAPEVKPSRTATRSEYQTVQEKVRVLRAQFDEKKRISDELQTVLDNTSPKDAEHKTALDFKTHVDKGLQEIQAKLNDAESILGEIERGTVVEDAVTPQRVVTKQDNVPIGDVSHETSVGGEPPTEGKVKVAGRYPDNLTYDQFASEYTDAFNNMNKYGADEAGASIWAERMATLADKYPEFLQKLESKVEAEAGISPEPGTPVPKEGKKPWEMTKGEYTATARKSPTYKGPSWVSEQMRSEGKNPDRLLNEIDAARPETKAQLASDPLTQYYDSIGNTVMADRMRRGDLSAVEYASGLHEMEVARALSEGKLTPERAAELGHFDSYPDLAAKYGKAKKMEPLPTPERVSTGNESADAARNLAHQKRFIQSLEERIAEDGDQADVFRRQLVEAKDEEAHLQRQFDEIQNRMEEEFRSKIETPEEPAPTTSSVPNAGEFKTEVVKVSDLKTDPGRFQNRQNEFSEESVQRIVDGYDPAKLDPVIVWKDPSDGNTYLLSGHSRFEAMRRLNKESIPVRYFEGTEAEAVKFAKVEANRLATKETLVEDVEAYRRAKESGASKKELEDLFRDATSGQTLANKLDAWMHLDRKGKFMEILSQGASDQFPRIRMWAQTVGDLRKQFPKMTNRHEAQIFDVLYPKEGTQKSLSWSKEQLLAQVETQVTDMLWDPNTPLVFKRSEAPVTGAAARSDTGWIVREIEETKETRQKLLDSGVGTKEQYDALTAKIEKLQTGIAEIVRNQGSLFGDGSVTLGFFGDPETAAQLARRVWSGLRGVMEYARVTREAVSRPPMSATGLQDALTAMIRHDRAYQDGYVQMKLLTDEVNRLVPDRSRHLTLAHAVQQGPGSRWWSELSNSEKAVASVLREFSQQQEQFYIGQELIQKPKNRPDGQVYLFGHYVDPNTGKPYDWTFGKFSKSAPQMFPKEHQTLEAGIASGLSVATTNPGTLLGMSNLAMMRALRSREMYKSLNSVEYDGSVMVGDRPAMMIESWKTLKEHGLEDAGWVRVDDRFLDRPIRYQTARGETRIIDGPVGVREEVLPYLDAYKNQPSYGRLSKLFQVVKAAKLTGAFHLTSLEMQRLADWKIPFSGYKRGKMLIEKFDEDMQGLVKEGLEVEAFKDLGVNPTDMLRFDKSVLGVAGNVVMAPSRALSHLIFDIVHPRIKAATAYEKFQQIWPEYQRDGLPKEQAYRDAVKFADQMYGGERYQRALLETNAAMVRYYYAATARKVWHSALISPTWQLAHYRMFRESLKSVVPNSVLEKIGMDPQAGISKAYRKYLFGALALYGMADMWNYGMTQVMDGDGKHMLQNPGGFRFKIRMPYNDPDGRPVYAKPFKSIFEVPGQIVGAVQGVSDGDFSVFWSKLNPLLSEGIKFFYNLDEYGQSRPATDTMIDKLTDLGAGLITPISVSQVIDAAKGNRAPISAVISNLGFPVSKGPVGGEWGKAIDEFKVREWKDRKDAFEEIDKLILDGKETEAAVLMSRDLKMGPEAIANRFMRYSAPLQLKWKNLHWQEQAMFLMNLSEKERQDFISELEKESQDNLMDKGAGE